MGWNPFRRKPAAPADRPGGVKLIELAGDVDGDRAAHVTGTIAGVLAAGAVRIAVDCRAVTFFDAEGIGAILAELARIRRAGGDVKLFGLKPDVRALVLEEYALDGPIEVFETEAAALEKFAQDTRPRTPVGEERFWLRTEERDGAAVIWLEGALDRAADGKRLGEAVRAAVQGGPRGVVLECGDLLWASSDGLGAILNLSDRVRKAGGRASLVGPLGVVNVVCGALGLDALLDRHGTLEEALAAVRA
ncbi:MAG TPA: STAS domain-containing protein [Planctomycetota bacterium]|nr:STAS domain-containing protein [Planctomycetota bacterium]